MRYFVWLVLLFNVALGQDAPRVLDKKFWAVSAFTISATLADSYTTSWFAENRAAQWYQWHPYGYAGIPCASEGGEVWLYGRVPSPARSYEVGLGKIAAGETAAYFLKRSHRFHRFWSAPLFFIGVDSSIGAVNNATHC